MHFPLSREQLLLSIEYVENTPISLVLAKRVSGHYLEDDICLVVYVAHVLDHPKKWTFLLFSTGGLHLEVVSSVLHLEVYIDCQDAGRHL